MTNQPGTHGQTTHGGGVAAGARMYEQHHPTGPALGSEDLTTTQPTRTYSADEIRGNKVALGRAMADAAKGNQSAKDALKEAGAVDAAVAALDPLMLPPAS